MVKVYLNHLNRKEICSFCLILCIFILDYSQIFVFSLHPPDCEWIKGESNEIDRLNCIVEFGQSLIIEEEVSGIGPEYAKSLWVTCLNPFNSYDESTSNIPPSSLTNLKSYVLTHGVFMAVPNLQDLQLENCPIAGITPGALSYLQNLQNLTIKSKTSLQNQPTNSLISSSTSLEIKTGVFHDLPKLKKLDLSLTSLSSLPSDFLCFLPSISTLNLTNCWLRDFQSVGIMPSDPTNPSILSSCASKLTTLILSYNHFTLVPPGTFILLKKLTHLYLDYNSITLAAERALFSLTSLETLSLAGNQLKSIPPEFFKDNPSLKEIYLGNNTISVLGPGLFNSLIHLTLLDLSHNQLTSEWVNGETFNGLLRLLLLNLSYNKLTKIDSTLFRQLYNLQILNLENNRIHHIQEDAFSGMLNLHTLILSHNHLKFLDDRICKGLSILSYLILDNNLIEVINDETFKNCTNIEDLNLSGNKLKEVPFALKNLILLRTLDMGENNITFINNSSFNWKYLYGLRLTGNQIAKISKNAFTNLVSLKIVNLAENNITYLEEGTFDTNPNLHAIRLDINKLSNLTGLFKNVPNLLWLNISANLLINLDYNEIPSRLQLLNLQHNQISRLSSTNSDSYRIRTLDLSFNNLKEISSVNIPDSIEKLILSHNELQTIQPYTFFRKPNLTFVDLSYNNLITLDQNALRISSTENKRIGGKKNSIVEILIGHNPLQCDCSMEWLQSIHVPSLTGNEEITRRNYPIILDPSQIKCSLTNDKTLVKNHQKMSNLNQFLCKYETHCFASCSCCEFDACDCEMSCPHNCTCYHDQGWSINVVDCSSQDKTIIPGRIPMDVTQLFLDGNIFQNLDSLAFIGRKNLRSLYLNGSHIEYLQNRTFYGLRQLRTLHLENNFISVLEGYEFDELENLEELYLHQNNLRFIGNNTFSKMDKLKILWLHGNNFYDLKIWTITSKLIGNEYKLRGLIDLTLRGNEWTCDCEFTNQLKEWLIKNSGKISDVTQIHCIDQLARISSSTKSESSSELIVVRLIDQKNPRCNYESNDLSVTETILENEISDINWTKNVYIHLMIVLIILIFLILITFGFCLYWRKPLRIWLYAKFGLRLDRSACCCNKKSASESDKLFDAFVSYSSKDEAWVRQVFANELEKHSPPFRICLRYRDLPSTGNYLADTIVQAAEASSTTILILSHHFLKGEWSRSDVKSAHHSLLKDRNRKAIIILLGDLPSKELDPDVRLYLKYHTFISSDDKRFWDKLYYSLPDIKNTTSSSQFQMNRNSTRSNHNLNYQQTNNTLNYNPPPLPPSNPPPLIHKTPSPHPHQRYHHITTSLKQNPNESGSEHFSQRTNLMCTNSSNTHTLIPILPSTGSTQCPPLPPNLLHHHHRNNPHPNVLNPTGISSNRHMGIHI